MPTSRPSSLRCATPTSTCLLLLTTHYSLLTTHYSLLTTHYSLLTTHYTLLTTHYALYSLLPQVRHLPYYTVASFMTLPWLATNAVYYLGDHQVRSK